MRLSVIRPGFGKFSAALVSLAMIVGPGGAMALKIASPVAVDRSPAIRATGGRAALAVDNGLKAALAAGPERVTLTGVPLAGGRSADFELTRFEVFAADAVIYESDGDGTRPLARPRTVFYRGVNTAEPDESVFVAVDQEPERKTAAGTGGELRLLATHPKLGSSTIAGHWDAGAGRFTHELEGTPADARNPFRCGTDELPVMPLEGVSAPSARKDAGLASATTLEAQMYLDIGNDLYVQKGSNSAVVLDYCTKVVAASSAIYLRDINTALTIKTSRVWNTADPFSPGTAGSLDQLNNYRTWCVANRGGAARDFHHLLAYKPNYGGVAYVGALCTTDYGYGLSNLYANYTYPTTGYTWDVNIVTHEIGHNFNSPHTQCYSPPIDCCYNQDCNCGTQAPVTGTIMSYCHLTNGTGQVALYFHPTCVTRMRTYAEGSSCLTEFLTNPTPRLTYLGVETPAGSNAPSVAAGTLYSTAAGTPVTRFFRLSNAGGGTFTRTGAAVLSGTDAAVFSVSQPGTSYPANTGSDFSVTFSPLALGTRRATVSIPLSVTIPGTSPATSTFTFAVEGAGVATGPLIYPNTGSPVAIPDGPTGSVQVPINVSNFPGVLADVDFLVKGSDCSGGSGNSGFGIDHTFIGDLRLTLISPSGIQVVLANSRDNSGDHMCGTTLDDEAAGGALDSQGSAAAPFRGSFTPAAPLSAFDGQNPNGTWFLKVDDVFAQDTGNVRAIELRLTPRDRIGNDLASSTGWTAFGAQVASVSASVEDTAGGALRGTVGAAANTMRLVGWRTGASNELPYGVVGPNRWVRAKFSVYRGGSATPSDLNLVPNMRLRVSNRFAVAQFLEVNHHNSVDPEGNLYGAELVPSADPAKPSVYRVDFDPVDVPFLAANSTTEMFWRGFESYSIEPQDAGFLALTESSIAVYPVPPAATGTLTKQYLQSRGDFAAATIGATTYFMPAAIPLTVDAAASPAPYGLVNSFGLTLVSQGVASNRLAVVTGDMNSGAASEDANRALRARVSEGQMYQVRFHASSAVASSAQAQVRLRARSAKFVWNSRLELGGAWATGTDATVGNAALAQQALPGLQCQNPDRATIGETNGGWYSVLLHSPLSADIRPEFSGGTPLSVRMPNLAGQDGPGVDTGKRRRDIVTGVDLIDTISPGPNAALESGQVSVDRIEVRAFPLPPD